MNQVFAATKTMHSYLDIDACLSGAVTLCNGGVWS